MVDRSNTKMTLTILDKITALSVSYVLTVTLSVLVSPYWWLYKPIIPAYEPTGGLAVNIQSLIVTLLIPYCSMNSRICT